MSQQTLEQLSAKVRDAGQKHTLECTAEAVNGTQEEAVSLTRQSRAKRYAKKGLVASGLMAIGAGLFYGVNVAMQTLVDE